MADREQLLAAVAVASACWLTASTFLLRMSLRHRWFTRMTAIVLVLTTIYALVQVSVVGNVSTLVLAVSLVGGGWVVAVGYVFGWPSIPVWASNLTGGFAVLGGSAYLLYRRLAQFRSEPVETPA